MADQTCWQKTNEYLKNHWIEVAATIALCGGVALCLAFVLGLELGQSNEHKYKHYDVEAWLTGNNGRFDCTDLDAANHNTSINGAWFRCNNELQKVVFKHSSVAESVCEGDQRFEVKVDNDIDGDDQECETIFDAEGESNYDHSRVRASYENNYEKYEEGDAIVYGLYGVTGLLIVGGAALLTYQCCCNKQESASLAAMRGNI